MRDIVIWHRQDRDLCNRALAGTNTTCAFVQRRQVTIQITRVTFSAGHFTADVRNLAQGFAIIGHIGKNHQHVHARVHKQDIQPASAQHAG